MSNTGKSLPSVSSRSTRSNPIGEFQVLGSNSKTPITSTDTLANAGASASGLSQSLPIKTSVPLPIAVPIQPTPPATPLQDLVVIAPLPLPAIPAFNMAAKGSVFLNSFSGESGEDPTAFIASMSDYIDFKSIPAAKQLSFFKLRLSGIALTWLLSLPPADCVDFDTLKASFLSRFQPRELEKYRFATELFNDKQRDDQSCDDYITC